MVEPTKDSSKKVEQWEGKLPATRPNSKHDKPTLDHSQQQSSQGTRYEPQEE
jgi:hypothetical protein